MTAPQVPLALLSAALNEIYRLRAGAAVESQALADLLHYATLPVGARTGIQGASERLAEAARGGSRHTWDFVPQAEKQEALISVGAKPTLTRSAWEAEQ